MNANAPAAGGTPVLTKTDPDSPCLVVLGAQEIAIKAGTVFAGIAFEHETPVVAPAGGYVAGADYAVVVGGGVESATAIALIGPPSGTFHLGGFHFAPGGNAPARAGGDEVPAINPFSVWDLAFRPACADPRGMALVIDRDDKKFWCDIYLLAQDHLKGTSRHGVTIADGDDAPEGFGETAEFDGLDYATAKAVFAHHGKQLLSFDEFIAAAHGVTEKSAAKGNPKKTGLDAKRTSQRGIMQATGNMWSWGHDGDPDEPRASIFGGSWLYVDDAGSRCANVAYYWPEDSHGSIGARGRCDHLSPA